MVGVMLGGSSDRIPNLIGAADRGDGDVNVYESNPETLEIRSSVLSPRTRETNYEKFHRFESEDKFSLRVNQVGEMLSGGYIL